MIEIDHFWGEISNYEEKVELAEKIAGYVKDGQTISIGSGSTSYVAIQKIAEKVNQENLSCRFLASSYEMELAARKFGLNLVSDVNQEIDWGFDGTDEIDPDKNLLKGRGGAMLREKILFSQAKKCFVLADDTKKVDKLGSKFSVPCEVNSHAVTFVCSQLEQLGGQPVLRTGSGKDGPVIAESGNIIVDVKHLELSNDVNTEFLKIPGLVETGLFYNFNPEII